MTRLYICTYFILYTYLSVYDIVHFYIAIIHIFWASYYIMCVVGTYIISSAFDKLFICFCSSSKPEYFIVYANFNNCCSIMVLVILCSHGILLLYISVCIYFKSYNRADVRKENYVTRVWVLSLIVDHIVHYYYGCGA